MVGIYQVVKTAKCTYLKSSWSDPLQQTNVHPVFTTSFHLCGLEIKELYKFKILNRYMHPPHSLLELFHTLAAQMPYKCETTVTFHIENPIKSPVNFDEALIEFVVNLNKLDFSSIFI